ncbi:hypothetical protein PoB_004509000 [Plakobranchus ocellatus]|uniref:Uncharacterized protein n=1 Tax=Plakobranchus ocellatus TaxID=259542 RepID=A0AAV4BHL1_9GAST|nr:hypothetical protein PoB_004509000 [Plakobranchus ocellatus]
MSSSIPDSSKSPQDQPTADSLMSSNNPDHQNFPQEQPSSDSFMSRNIPDHGTCQEEGPASTSIQSYEDKLRTSVEIFTDPLYDDDDVPVTPPACLTSLYSGFLLLGVLSLSLLFDWLCTCCNLIEAD